MIYFLSDAHLGSLATERGWAQQAKLIQLLEEMRKDAESIYLLGDMFDFWMEYYRRDKKKREFAPFFTELRRLTESGIHVHFFIGNHDMWTFGGIEELCGAEVHYSPASVTHYGKTLYLCHGDGVMPSNWQRLYPKPIVKKIKRFMFLQKVFHNSFLQKCFRCLPPSWGNHFGYNWAKKSRLKELAKPCPYKGEDKEELVLFAKEQEELGNHHDYYVFGHRHIELDLQIRRDSRVIILGDCFRQWTYAKLDDQGKLSLHNFD